MSLFHCIMCCFLISLRSILFGYVICKNDYVITRLLYLVMCCCHLFIISYFLVMCSYHLVQHSFYLVMRSCHSVMCSFHYRSLMRSFYGHSLSALFMGSFYVLFYGNHVIHSVYSLLYVLLYTLFERALFMCPLNLLFVYAL